MEQMIANFEIYEDANRYLGIAKVTMPTETMKSVTISGVGIAGEVDAIAIGQPGAMEITLDFENATKDAITLSEPRIHQLDLRPVQQVEDVVNGTVSFQPWKYVVKVFPKSYNYGSIAPASTASASGTYAVRYLATYVDGEKVKEIDPLNNIYKVNGVDYLEDLRAGLGQ